MKEENRDLIAFNTDAVLDTGLFAHTFENNIGIKENKDPLWNQYKKFMMEKFVQSINKSGRKHTLGGFFGYLGGKKNQAKDLISIFPKHYKYVEVFCGSGAVYFTKPKAKFNIINDISENLVNLFRVAQSEDEDFFFYLVMF